MRISIITPSLNQAPFLQETIDSVLSQNNDNLQYIIIDGGSYDNSRDIIEEYDQHLDYWVSESDEGQSHAINKGLRRITGEVINWLNSDDYYEPNALQKVSDTFSDGITGVGGRSRLFNAQGTIKHSSGTDIYQDNLFKTIGWARIDQPATFFSKEAWEKVGLLNEDLHYCMDREWWMRYLYTFGLGGFKKVNVVLVNFRIHGASKTQTAQVSFEKEHHSLYYQMGLVAGWKDATDFMHEKLDINSHLKTAISKWENKDLTAQSFNYYLLKSAEEFYAQSNWPLAKGFIRFVQSDLLAREDQKLYKKLVLRLRMPLSLIRWFRKG